MTPFDTDMKCVVPSMFVVIILLQVEMARPYCKFAARPSSLGKIPYVVEKVCSVLTLSDERFPCRNVFLQVFT